MTGLLRSLAVARREGSPIGVTSVCSAHPLVIRAAARNAARFSDTLVIEATCNQVNQFGGYTGMLPGDFVRLVQKISAEEKLPTERIIFGGDHLGPNPWRREHAGAAMAKAEEMVTAYVSAGFRKIHLDASMGCAGEPAGLDDATTAERAARLALAAERAARAAGGEAPVYIIGTEVPAPGGANHAISDIEPTSMAAATHTIDVHRDLFLSQGLADAFSRVIALVVQPGVEFGNENVVLYDPAKARGLTQLLEQEPGLVFEAHSTDYQGRTSLRQLVEDGFPILKVGPELTFVLREALYGLDLIATDLLPHYGARPLYQAMERLMLAEPANWQGHYHGSEAEQRLQRHYSFSDRIRYYWNQPEAEAAVASLTAALRGKTVPPTLFRQHLPAFEAFAGKPLEPTSLLIASIQRSLDEYRFACTGEALDTESNPTDGGRK
ncbi:D-tagatose-bisphosphate aldolase, class II, non-catalytic subunit [Mesorhizobium sp. STM 4661]|uniref:D-tagatose-bisphosphate aldolase, class II, non-catalytic subunit n=1 Tax=Mesorhizobium sp. STM 4661 TaxID=1297570 RepID=UPI0002BF5734|nr:D-tagatose-bisphosphate aldolase, class II, non-catalytic subunit [Mesorhizobium sp. STM 4661]CCV15307.1 tagatose 6-phosphate aldolase 1, kbaZ subunit [Mesorhizobium sp. STM 4661]